MTLKLFDKRLLAAGIVLALAWILAQLVKEGTIEFKELQLGESYYEAHPKVGYKLFYKVDANVASAFRQTCSGRQHNDFVLVKPEHRVAKAGRWED